MSIDPSQQTAAALKWLYEMEAVSSPVLRANLYENIYLADRGILDCAAWITPTFTYQKGVLIWVKLSNWTKWFRKDEAYSQIESVVKGLLPSYDVRVVSDRNILEMAEKRLQEAYGGSSNEKSNTDNSTDNSDTIDKSASESEGVPSEKTSNILPDTEKQVEPEQEVRNETEQCNPQEEQKAQDIVEDLCSDIDAGKSIQPKS